MWVGYREKLQNLTCNWSLTLVIFCVSFLYMLNSGIMEINLHVFPDDTVGDFPVPHVKSSIVNFSQFFTDCA